MKLDRNLTAQQLWTIAADAEHRSADLLDDLVDHPATYRALSDWAVAGLAMTDLRALPVPPEPEEATETPKRGLRLPSLRTPARRGEASVDTSAPVPAPEPEGVDAWLAAAPMPPPARWAAPAASGEPPSSRKAKQSWLKRPAPMGLVLLLLVLQIVMLMTLGVIVRREGAQSVSAPASVLVVVAESEGGRL